VSDPSGGEAAFLTLVVGAAVDADPSYAFSIACLQDVIDGVQFQQLEASQGINNDGIPHARYQCDDTKTKVTTISIITEDGRRERVRQWQLYICKSATCDTDTLNQVLNSISLDYYALEGNPFDEGTIVSDTVTPSTECFHEQIGETINDPDVYCSGESAPVCINKKLIEIKLGTDAPFEIAVCDDNDCLASLGDAPPYRLLERWIYWLMGGNQYCMPVEMGRQTSVSVDITVSEKEFNLSDYCSAAAASGRTGRWVASETTNTPTQAPTVKVVASETTNTPTLAPTVKIVASETTPKPTQARTVKVVVSETESAPAESAAWMTMESFVLKCFVGLLPLLLL